jgi:hypothetical protein
LNSEPALALESHPQLFEFEHLNKFLRLILRGNPDFKYLGKSMHIMKHYLHFNLNVVQCNFEARLKVVQILTRCQYHPPLKYSFSEIMFPNIFTKTQPLTPSKSGLSKDLKLYSYQRQTWNQAKA